MLLLLFLFLLLLLLLLLLLYAPLTRAHTHTRGAGTSRPVKRVWRHLHNDDILLVNRQPTLHKPSIMAHRARVLTTQSTIRMNYVNCSTYNADFDGDEMNLHFPQDELARSEAYNLIATQYQFLVPTSGKPLRGLIQDHIDMGVLLTKRDNLLDRDQYQHLVYAGVCGLPRFAPDKRQDIPWLPPAILKPKPLWTGKQVRVAAARRGAGAAAAPVDALLLRLWCRWSRR